ncbi:hypothetical protein [Microbacterium sp. 5K110]|jgi:hypothetical protein|uniref:hypothetical protein n=1 Tax=unclassified Microbacterium TaxID=2609290 RepID=UPI0010FCE8E2|nr:hypothetical protein [Microbacterium sp. 5K110]TLF33954.1 hypothetical protein FE256_02235 [Microbacterium sp. 5K110]
MKEFWARVARWFTDSRRQAVQASIASLVALFTMLGVTTQAQSSALLDLSASALLLVQGVIGLSLLRRSDAYTWLNEHGRGAVYALALAVGAVGVAFTAWGDDTAAQIATVTTAVLSIFTAFVQVVNVGTLSSPWPLADPPEWQSKLAAFATTRAAVVEHAKPEENPATFKTERDPAEAAPASGLTVGVYAPGRAAPEPLRARAVRQLAPLPVGAVTILTSLDEARGLRFDAVLLVGEPTPAVLEALAPTYATSTLRVPVQVLA